MTALNIYLFIISFILIFSIFLEIYQFKSFLSPIIWILANIFPQYIIGAFYLVNFPKMLPNIKSQNIFIEQSLDIIFVQVCAFSLCYFLISHYLKKRPSPTFHFQIDNWKGLSYFTTLGLLGAFSLFSLIYYDLYGAGAYSSMRGMGWANWLLIIFLVPHCFLYLGNSQKKSRVIGIICFVLLILFYGGLLNRRLNTITFFWVYLLCLISPFEKRSIKKQLIFGFLFIIIAALFLYLNSRNPVTQNLSFLNRFNQLMSGQFGGFSSLVFTIETAISKNITLPSKYLLTYLPFQGYIPYIKDLNYELSKFPEIWKLGEIYYYNGSLSFTDPGTLFLFGGKFFVGLMAAFWGLFFAIANWQMRAWSKNQQKNDVNLGLYALICMSNSSLFIPNINDFIFAFIMVIFLGKMVVIKYEETADI